MHGGARAPRLCVQPSRFARKAPTRPELTYFCQPRTDSGGVDPDHTPHLLGDDADDPLGWTLAMGYIAALRDVSMQSYEARL